MAEQEEENAQIEEDVLDTFGMDTEAGRLLRRMAGGRRPPPKINYPRVRTKPSGPRQAFVPGGGKAEVDARKKTRRDVDLKVPSVGRQKLPHFAPIELRQGRRKFKEEIDADEAAKVEDIAQPPITKAVATEAEKRRLQTYFEFKGGKALPEEMTLDPVKGPIPLSMLTSAEPRHPSARRGGSRAVPEESEQLRELRKMKAAIEKEITEKKDFLQRMTELDPKKAKSYEGVIGRELQAHNKELEEVKEMIVVELKK